MASFIHMSEAASLGLHTMALLAKNGKQRFTTQQIADKLEASANHLAKVLQRLARVGLVSSTRGPQGGFLLNKRAENVTLLEIYEAIDGPVEDAGCVFGTPLCEGIGCLLGRKTRELDRQFRDYLNETTLAELADSLRLPAADNRGPV